MRPDRPTFDLLKTCEKILSTGHLMMANAFRGVARATGTEAGRNISRLASL
jgi:hypothetical protein